jgi:hypothetical protein
LLQPEILKAEPKPKEASAPKIQIKDMSASWKKVLMQINATFSMVYLILSQNVFGF